MRLSKDNELIQAFAAKRANQMFGNSVLPGRPGTDRPVADTHRCDPSKEDLSVGLVIVADQVLRRRAPRERFSDLPSQPLWMLGHLKPQQLPPAMAQNQKGE